MEMEAGRGDHRTTAGALVTHDRSAGQRAGEHAIDPPSQRQVLPRGETLVRDSNREKGDDEVSGMIPDDVAFRTYVILRLSRLGRYARWADGLGTADPRPPEVRSWWGPVVMNGNVEQTGLESIRDLCPVDIIEADETRRCILALPEHLRDTIVQEYVVCGNQQQKARALGIEPRTFRHRLTVAHSMLLGLFNDVSAGLDPYIQTSSKGRPAKQTTP